jgi:hypothetical protein
MNFKEKNKKTKTYRSSSTTRNNLMRNMSSDLLKSLSVLNQFSKKNLTSSSPLMLNTHLRFPGITQLRTAKIVRLKLIADDEDEVLGYLKQYEKIDDMPPEILGKVLAYYENLKNPNTQAPPSTQNQVPQDNSYQRRNSSRKSEAPSSLITAEKREPIKPRESAGGIIYGSAKDIDAVQKPSTSCTQVFQSLISEEKSGNICVG